MGLFGKSKKEKAADLMATGSRGIGEIVSVQDTGMTINDNPRVKMTFRVEPIDGSAAIELQKTKTVSRVDIPRQGERYGVFYDPVDPKSWAYVVIADDSGRAQLREIFGAAAETLTGMNSGSAAPVAAAAPGADPLDQLRKLDELHKQGVLTDAEFQTKKTQLLADV